MNLIFEVDLSEGEVSWKRVESGEEIMKMFEISDREKFETAINHCHEDVY